MATDGAKELRVSFTRQNWIFNLSLLVCVLVGVLCIGGSVLWKHESQDAAEKLLIFQLGQSIPEVPSSTASLADQIRDLFAKVHHNTTLGPDILRDLGIALLISAFVTFSIERYASNRLRQHITYDVLSAAYGKVVPEKIYTQVADNVFRSDVYPRQWGGAYKFYRTKF